MRRQTKAAGYGDSQAAHKISSSDNHIAIASLIKAAIVTLAPHGPPPFKAAGWLIQRGELRDG
jgi:hypothetical protein